MRIDLPEDKRLVHETRFPIRWGDMDLMGHVNNAVYFRYMETVRIDWMTRVGMAPDPRGTGPVIANAFCNFLVQLEYPGEVAGKLYLGAAGRSSFDMYTTLERVDRPGVVCAAGGATTVWVDFQAGKSQPLPDFVRRLIAGD